MGHGRSRWGSEHVAVGGECLLAGEQSGEIDRAILALEAEARAGLLAKPGDERLAKQANAPEGLLKVALTKVDRLRRQGQQP
jgi:hypothetical protein